MEHVITTYGGGELFTLVFNAIAALFKADRTGMVMTLIRIGLMVGSVYVVILMFLRNNLQEGLKWFLWVVVATNLLFLPKTTVWIDDPLMKTKEKVDHVPFALGFFAGFVSQMGRAITEKVESVFTLPDYMPYHQTGTVFASSLMSQVGQFRITDPVFKGNMERFINQCVVYDAMIGHKYTLTDLQNQNDIWTLVSSKASPVLGFLYKDGNNPGEVITCKAGAQKLNTLWKTEIEKATAVYGSRVQNQKLTKTLFFSHLHNGYQLLSGISKSAEDILKQEMMINAIEEASNNKLSELGATSNYAATKALLQQRSAYATAGEIAARTLPLFKNVIEALSYALFIFIVVLALLPNGYRILMTYCGILVWTQLWAPLYAVLNLIMTLYGTSETKSVIGEGLTLLNSAAIINRNADMTTLAAWLSVSIPFISYGILKQGAAAFVGIAQHLGSAMESAASGAAAETVSGNVSLGNFTMGTQVYQNTSAFQHTTSPNYNASQFKSMGASGVEQSTFADGTQAFNDQAMSRLSVQIMGTENTSYAEQQSFNNAWSVAQSKNVAATEATEASLQHATNFFSQLGTDRFKGEDYSKNISASEAKSLQNFKHFTNTLQKDLHLNEAQAAEVALGVGIGGGLKFLHAEGKGNFSSTAARQKAFQDAKAVADQIGYSENTERVISAAKALSEGSRDSKGAGLGENVSASFNKAKGLREEASIAQNKVDTLSKEKSSSESKAITISKELTQEVLEFIAHQPANPGPDGVSGGQIGYKEARRILEHGGGERAAYLKRFQEENPQYSIQSINVHGAQQKLDMQYETQAQAHRNSADIQAQNASHVQSVHQHAKDTGFDKPRIEQTFSNPKESENSQQKESPVEQVASQSIDHSINGGRISPVQDNVQTQPQQSTDNAGTQAQTPSRVQSAQPAERDAGLDGGNSDKFHSENIPLHQIHSDKAPLHSKQIENSPQENAVKQTAPQFSGQSIHGGSTTLVQDNVQTQPQQHTDASIQTQTPSHAQSIQPEERDAGVDKENSDKFHSGNTPLHQIHSDQAPLHSKQDTNPPQENTAKQAVPHSTGQSIHGGSTPPVQDNAQIQSQQNIDNASIQVQTLSRAQNAQPGERDAGLGEENSDKSHSGNTPLHQFHSDQAPLHSKQAANSSQESSVKQAASQSVDHSINGRSTPPVQDNIQIHPQQNTGNASIQAQTPPHAQSMQPEGREAGLGEGNSDKFHSSNIPLDQIHSDQALLHSKQDTNSSQENTAQQAVPQFSGQSIHGGSTPPVQDNIQIQSQQHTDASIQTQTPSHAQSMQPEERDTGLGEGKSDKFHSRNTPLHQIHSDQAPFDSKQIENFLQENTVKQAAPRSTGQSIDEGKTPFVNTSNEIQTQPQPNNASDQVQNLSNGQMVQQHLKEEVSDKPKIENPQQESIKDFVEKKFEETDKKINKGKKLMTNQEKPLQDEYKEANDKTLLGTAAKNLVTSTGKGLLSVGKDVNEAIKKLPPEPPIIFP